MQKIFRQIPTDVFYLILTIFVITAGAFLVLPILTIFLQEQLKLTITQIGVLISVKLWAQWGGAIFGGKISDSIGPKPAMILGFILRIVSFLIIVNGFSYASVFIGMTLLGLSAALFNPASKAALTLMSTLQNRVLIFSLRETAINLGIAIGPLFGLLAGATRFEVLFYSGAIVYGLLAITVSIFLPRFEIIKRKTDLFASGSLVFFNKDLLILALLYAFFFLFFSQLEMLIPLYAGEVFTKQSSFLVFILNAVTIISLQLPLNSKLSSKAFFKIIILTSFLISFGFLLMSFKNELVSFLIGVLCFSIGEIIVGPRIEAEYANKLPPHSIGLGLGLLGFSAGIGSTIGSMAGGSLYENFSNHGQTHLYWLCLSCLGALGVLGGSFMKRANDSNII